MSVPNVLQEPLGRDLMPEPTRLGEFVCLGRYGIMFHAAHAPPVREGDLLGSRSALDLAF